MRRGLTRTGAALIGALAIVGGLLGAAPALAKDDDLKKDVEALQKTQEQILQQLQEIKKMLQAAPAQQRAPAGANVKDVVFNLGTNPTHGSEQAKLTLVEFTDYQ
jgi:protein-disulfide isomerase